MKNAHRPLHLLIASLLLCATAAHADIQVGDGTTASTAAGKPLPELVLIVWDRTAKVSYTMDLGVTAYATAYASGDTSKNLFVYGQQDAGYQKLFPALNQDVNFQTFLSRSSSQANQVWAVVGAELNSDAGGIGAGAFTLFTTLNTGSMPNGTTNPFYFDFAGMDAAGNPNPNAHFNNSELSDSAGNFATWAINQNTNGLNTSNTHQCALTPGNCSVANASITNGSSFDTESSIGYAGVFLGGPGGTLVGNTHGSILNPVGKSSWFYRAVVSNEDGDKSILVDEFDNGTLSGGHDAYWGLGVDTNGNYILSYTLEASLMQPQSAAGALLRLRTDFTANYGRARLINVPGGDTLNLGGNVTAVPEPATWGLMGLGLAVLAARTRRRGR